MPPPQQTPRVWGDKLPCGSVRLWSGVDACHVACALYTDTGMHPAHMPSASPPSAPPQNIRRPPLWPVLPTPLPWCTHREAQPSGARLKSHHGPGPCRRGVGEHAADRRRLWGGAGAEAACAREERHPPLLRRSETHQRRGQAASKPVAKGAWCRCIAVGLCRSETTPLALGPSLTDPPRRYTHWSCAPAWEVSSLATTAATLP